MKEGIAVFHHKLHASLLRRGCHVKDAGALATDQLYSVLEIGDKRTVKDSK